MNTFIRKFTSSPSQYGGCITLTKQVVVKCLDENKTAIDGAKVVINNYDDGNRIDYTINPDEGYGAFSNFTTVTRTSLTTSATGLTTQSEILMKAFVARPTDPQNDFNTIRFSKGATDDANFDITSVLYGKQITTNETSLNGNGLLTTIQNMLPDTSITEVDKATVDAYTDINTPEKFYDRAMSILIDGFVNETTSFVTRNGNTINLGSADLEIGVAGSVISKSLGNWSLNTALFTGNITTTGTVTYSNGAKVNGIVIDSTGTAFPPLNISITNISAGSRLLITNLTTNTETFNGAIAGTSYTASYAEGTGYSANDVVRVRITKTDGVTAKLGYESNTVATALGWSMLVSQEDDFVYNTIGVNGNTITDFAADYVNNQVDLIVTSNFYVSELYAWWSYNLTTDSGIRNFFGGITALDTANFRINTSVIDLYMDSTINVSVFQIDNRRFYRSDEAYPVNTPTTSGYGLDVVWRNTVLVTGLSPAQETKLYSLNTDNLDVAVSTRSTFNPIVDVVANVTIVDTVTTNTDMRGTNGANTIAPITPPTVVEIRAGFVADEFKATTTLSSNMRGTDNANIIAPDNTSIASILADTNDLQTNQNNWLTATGFSVFDNTNDEVITNLASRNASKANVLGLSTFNASSDVVANVNLVNTVTNNSDMRGTDGANTVTPITPPSVLEIRQGFNANEFKATETIASNMRGTDGANTVVPTNETLTDLQNTKLMSLDTDNLDVAVSTRATKSDADQALIDYNVDTKTNVKPSISV
jgi:hypothetical protein